MQVVAKDARAIFCEDQSVDMLERFRAIDSSEVTKVL